MRKSIIGIFISIVLIGGVRSVYAASPLVEIQDQIKGLLSKLQMEPVSISTECFVPVAPLALGSYGPEVKKLQIWLGQHGYPVVPAGKESQFFGPLTHFALIKLQSAVGIRPVSGFYGPITEKNIQERCAAEIEARTGLHVTEPDDAPEGGVVPADSIRVEVLRFDLTGDSILESVVVHRFGAARDPLFNQVYLFDGDVRLTAGYVFDKGTNTVSFTDLQLPIHGTKTLSVMADISGWEDVEGDGVEIISTDSIRAAGTISGSFPIRGGVFVRSEQNRGLLTIAKEGTLTEPVIGQRGVKVAEFRVTSEMNTASFLRSITLAFYSDFNSSLISNFVLRQGDATVAVASAVNARGQILLRTNESFEILPASRHTFSLYADFAPTIESDSIMQIYLKKPIDFYATGALGDQGVSVSSARYNNSSRNGTDASWLTIRGGIVTYAFRGPAVTNYAAGQRDIELMRFDLEAQDSVEVREMRIALAAGGMDAVGTMTTIGGLCNLAKPNYTDVKLVDANTGMVLTRGLDTACTTGDQDNIQTLVFTDRWQVGAGQTRTVKVIADVNSFTPAANETIKATLMAFEGEDIRNLKTGNSLNNEEVVPAGNMTGATHRVHANEQVANLANTLAAVLSDTPSVSY